MLLSSAPADWQLDLMRGVSDDAQGGASAVKAWSGTLPSELPYHAFKHH